MNFDDIPVGFSVIDFLCCLLIILLVWAKTDNAAKASIEMEGKYVVVASWQASSEDDVDLWVQNPAGEVVWFQDKNIGLMHLENDDLGRLFDYEDYDGKEITVSSNKERVVIRGVIPGEYTVNVHMYKKRDSGETPVVISLYKLKGNDKKIFSQAVVLNDTGDERTAFRFVLDDREKLVSRNNLPKHFVGRPVQG